MVHIQAQECISGHTVLPAKSLHKHFLLDAAICFIALSVYYAQPRFLSGRICPVSLSSIDFFFFFLQAWCGKVRRARGGDSSGEKKHEGDRLVGYHALCFFFCEPPAHLSIFAPRAKWMPFSLKLAEVKHRSRQQVSHLGWPRESWEIGLVPLLGLED